MAVVALELADKSLDDITGWSGGGGNWPAQDAHVRVREALEAMRGKRQESTEARTIRRLRALADAYRAKALSERDVYRAVEASEAKVQRRYRELRRTMRVFTTPRPREEWDEGDGPVLWWKLPVCEPPYVGDPREDDFPEYVTHWTPIVDLEEP